jgi:hypothetical protein
MKQDTKAGFTQTAKALRTITSREIKADLTTQLRQAESALKEDKKKAAAYMQGITTTVMVLRGALSARIAAGVLSGIAMDCSDLQLVLPMVNYTKKAKCVFNTGGCAAATTSWCMKIETVWGCGTIPPVENIHS